MFPHIEENVLHNFMGFRDPSKSANSRLRTISALRTNIENKITITA